MGNVELLLLDEPFEGLAPTIVETVWNVLHALKGETTLLLVEQNADLALALANAPTSSTTARSRGAAMRRCCAGRTTCAGACWACDGTTSARPRCGARSFDAAAWAPYNRDRRLTPCTRSWDVRWVFCCSYRRSSSPLTPTRRSPPRRTSHTGPEACSPRCCTRRSRRVSASWAPSRAR